MIQLNPEKFVKAAQKAREHKPYIRMVAWRRYECLAPSGNVYSIKFETRAGVVYADCNCKAGNAKQPCYHVAAAQPVDVGIVAMRQDSVAQREATWHKAHQQQVPAVLLKPQPPSMGRLKGIEL